MNTNYLHLPNGVLTQENLSTLFAKQGEYKLCTSGNLVIIILLFKFYYSKADTEVTTSNIYSLFEFNIGAMSRPTAAPSFAVYASGGVSITRSPNR